jgi:hypothetical protein
LLWQCNSALKILAVPKHRCYPIHYYKQLNI